MSPPVRDEGQDRAFELRSTLRLSRLAPCQPALIRSYPRACLSRCQSPRQKADFAAIRRSGGSVLWSLIAIKVHPMSLYRHRAAPARLGVRPRLGTLLRRQGALLLPRRPAGRRRRAPPARPRRQDLYPAPVALRLDRLAGGRDRAAHRGGPGRRWRGPGGAYVLVAVLSHVGFRWVFLGMVLPSARLVRDRLAEAAPEPAREGA